MNKKLILLIAFLILLLTACAPDAPQVSPTPSQTVEPPTITPTDASSPTATTAPPLNCTFDEDFLNGLKSQVPYKEFTLLYNILSEERTLLIWYVDPEIDPTTPDADFQQALTDARMRAAALANTLNQADPCVARLVDNINTIVVDANYAGWYSGQIVPDQLPGTDTPDEEQLRLSMARFQSGYLLDYTPEIEEAPADTCTWGTVNPILKEQFEADQQNIGFYYVVDPSGVNMWAQWIGSTDADEISGNVENILSTIDCLYPTLYNLVTIVVSPSTGEIISLGMLSATPDGMDIADYQVLYTAVAE
ncbi:hypothetical protein KQH61_03635 [bacterium]|nr:hypothetical protein [bacterium]MCB2178993.1 hypothetical protein [bacterium]